MVPLALLALGERKGVASSELASEVGLDPARLPGPEERLPLDVGLSLWRSLIRRFPADPLGLELAESWQTASLGLIGYLAANAETLGDALDRFIAFQGLVDGEARMTAIIESDTLVVSFTSDPPLVSLRHPMEALLASGHAFCQRLLGAPLTARRVHFGHPMTLDVAVYRRFFGVTPEARSARYELHYDATVLGLPIPGADPRLSGYLLQLAEVERACVSKVAPRTLRERLTVELCRRLDAGLAVALAECARSLGVSARALQRELESNATTFRAVALGERLRRAELHLSTPGATAMDAATAAGFAELASFSRAFKRWSGVSPAVYRRALLAPSPRSP